MPKISFLSRINHSQNPKARCISRSLFLSKLFSSPKALTKNCIIEEISEKLIISRPPHVNWSKSSSFFVSFIRWMNNQKRNILKMRKWNSFTIRQFAGFYLFSFCHVSLSIRMRIDVSNVQSVYVWRWTFNSTLCTDNQSIFSEEGKKPLHSRQLSFRGKSSRELRK